MAKFFTALFAVCLTAPLLAGVAAHTITIREPFGLPWGPDAISEPVAFARGQAVSPDALSLCDSAGRIVPMQLDDVTLWPRSGCLKTARVVFMASLAPDEIASWQLKAGAITQTAARVAAVMRDGVIELTNGLTGVRLAGGAADFTPPLAASNLPPPIQAVRLTDGTWVGAGRWESDLRCLGFRHEITAAGPVFARAKLLYTFEGGRQYSAVVELYDGQDLAIVREEFNLSEGRAYPMSGVDGMSPDGRYTYVKPLFDPPEKSLLWDWWGQTNARLPTPAAYLFSFGNGLNPDSADFFGRSQYGNLAQGDGGLLYNKDGRFAYLNAFLQWGDEETLYLGFWNRSAPQRQLAFVALQPEKWLHPDITPHPNATLQQYVQTACPTFERRTSGEVFMRAPVCLGRRVYGIGGVEQTLGRHALPQRNGPVATTNDVWGSDLMLRHIRLGRLRLDEVRRWTLWYDEPARYPRMYVPAGDMARYESRRARIPLDEARARLAARGAPSAAMSNAVAETIGKLRRTVQHFARSEYGHMDYGINLGLLANDAEEALASPACGAEQAADIRRWLAAIIYNARHPGFIPPREAGFAWGSANMMAQVQCRTCYLLALLPNHPETERWQRELARVVTLYVESQVAPSGATLECPHYGEMALTMPAHALAALDSISRVSSGRAVQRLQAAANARLNMLLPWDVRGGMRSASVEGDGYYHGDGTFAPLAGLFQRRDPRLARQLMWGLQQSGNKLGGHADASFKMVDPGLPPLAPPLRSTHIEGFGMIMRHGSPQRDETLLQIYAGDFSWGHGHTDRGTWVMYAGGAPLMADFAAMYTPSMRQQWLHPGGLTFDHDETVRPPDASGADAWWLAGANPQYRALQTAPFTAIEMRAAPDSTAARDTFGAVTIFNSTPQADYACMERRINYLHRVPYTLAAVHGLDLFDDTIHQEITLDRPFTWRRQFAFIKDDGPQRRDYLAVRDTLDGNTELNPYLNLWALADKLDVSGQNFVYRGQYGVDLYGYIAAPVAFVPQTRVLRHNNGFDFSAHYQKTYGRSFREEQVMLRIPQTNRADGYFICLVPVRQGQPAPTFATIDSNTIQVVFPERTDTLVMPPQTGPVILTTSSGGNRPRTSKLAASAGGR